MSRRIFERCCAGLVVGLFLLIPAQAAVNFQNLGTGAPPNNVGGIPVTPFNTAPQKAIADFTDVPSIPGGPGPVTLSQDMMKETLSAGAWGHGYAGPVFSTTNSSVTLTLPSNVSAFYVYVRPAKSGSFDITATTDSGVTSGTISVTGAGGANGFGFYSDSGGSISTITLSADAAAGGFYIGELGLAASNWAIVVNGSNGTISTIDLSTCAPTLHGPFLSSQLGPNAALTNVAVTPDGHYALVLGRYLKKVYRVDLTDPTNPVLVDSVTLPFTPVDVAISPYDGRVAFVTGGNSGEIAGIWVPTDSYSSLWLSVTYSLTTPGAWADAVAVAPEPGPTGLPLVVVTDPNNNEIIYGPFGQGGFVSETAIPADGPGNVDISPDGQTVLVPNVSDYSVNLFKISSQGVLSATGTVTGLPYGPECVAFSPDGSRAYVDSVLTDPCQLSTLDITGPGTANLEPGTVSLMSKGSNYSTWPYDAADSLAVSPDDRAIVAGSPLYTNLSSQPVYCLRTTDYAKSVVPLDTPLPAYVAAFMSTAGQVRSHVAVSPVSVPAAVAGTGYAQVFSATGGSGLYSFTFSGTPPAGMGFSNPPYTGILSGTPTETGDFSFTVTASDNANGCWGSQSYTLTVTCPTITVGPTAIPQGKAGAAYTTTAFTQTGGLGTIAWSESGTLPAGMSFDSSTATLSGTPTENGSFPILVTATDGNGCTGGESYTLVIDQAPAITSANAANFTVGTAGSFTVTTTGYPAPALSESGTLPSGVTFTDNGDGTATLAGTPAAGTGGAYSLTFTASNGTLPNGSQTFTLTVDQAPAITSANAATFTVGTAGTFTVTTTGYPAPALSESGTLPSGVTFTDNGDGTATLAGTAAAGSGGTYSLTFTASNGTLPNGTQTFTLTVDQAPAITSANSTTFTVGTAGTFTVTTTGYPAPALSESGTLPSGVTFTDNGNGTVTLAGTAAAGTGGTYSLSFTASNGTSPDATLSFTLTVNEAPAIASTSATTFTVGTAGSFSVTTSGYPAPALSESGALPSGVTFTDNGDGTATLAGTPPAGTGGTYSLTFTASNGTLPNGIQTFTLTVDQAPAITSANATTFTVGTAGTFTLTTTGYPTSALGESGALPSGVTFKDNGDGTATLSGTPGANTDGTYSLTITASNNVSPDATQAFTLTVVCPVLTVMPAPPLPDAAASLPYTRTFSVMGGSGPFTFGLTGALPAGLGFSGDKLSGTPTELGTFDFTVTAQDQYGCSTSRDYTLTVVCPTINVLPATLPAAVKGQAYDQTLTPSAGVAPFSYDVTGGALPAGLSLSVGGEITGTPMVSGTFNVTVTVTDVNGCTGSGSYALTAYTDSFHDDADTCTVCIDDASGAYQWTEADGQVFTGTLNVYDGGTMFWSEPGASQYIYIYYDPNSHSAWGYLYDYSTYDYCSLYDSNTLNDPPGCGVGQAAT